MYVPRCSPSPSWFYSRPSCSGCHASRSLRWIGRYARSCANAYANANANAYANANANANAYAYA